MLSISVCMSHFVLNFFFDFKIHLVFISVAQLCPPLKYGTHGQATIIKPTRVKVFNLVVTFFLTEWTWVTMEINVRASWDKKIKNKIEHT